MNTWSCPFETILDYLKTYFKLHIDNNDRQTKMSINVEYNNNPFSSTRYPFKNICNIGIVLVQLAILTIIVQWGYPVLFLCSPSIGLNIFATAKYYHIIIINNNNNNNNKSTNNKSWIEEDFRPEYGEGSWEWVETTFQVKPFCRQQRMYWTIECLTQFVLKWKYWLQYFATLKKNKITYKGYHRRIRLRPKQLELKCIF